MIEENENKFLDGEISLSEAILIVCGAVDKGYVDVEAALESVATMAMLQNSMENAAPGNTETRDV